MKAKQACEWQAGALVLAIVTAIGGWIIFLGSVPEAELKVNSQSSLRRPAGEAQVISLQPLPAAIEGAECQWVPASAHTTLLAALQEEKDQPAGEKPNSDKIAEVRDRKPVRTIRDSYPGYSAVAVDLLHDEVVMTDESTFNILTYNRKENTPPSATMSEPKRMIGGLNTWIEFECGVYVDQRTGDIYAVNNDTVDRLVVFSRKAKGNVAPDRIIRTPHGTYGIAVDEEHQELFLTVQAAGAVSVFKKAANEDEPPIRLLQGKHTGLADPHGIAVDTKRRLLFVSNFGSSTQHEVDGRNDLRRGGPPAKPNWPQAYSVPGSGTFASPTITVYPMDAAGDVAPIRVIEGPNTKLDWPTALSVDTNRGELFVANDAGNSILVFNETGDGDVPPIRRIEGPKSMVRTPTGVFFDEKHDELWVSNFGNHTAAVYKANASGDVPPLRVIRSAPLDKPTPNIGNAFAAAYDPNREEILVPN